MKKVTTIIVNNKQYNPESLRKNFCFLCDKNILVQNSGFLFQIVCNLENFHFGFLPVLSEGKRNYHYDIKITKKETDFVFSGCINPDFSLTLIPILTKNLMKNFCSHRETFISHYQLIAEFFILCGFKPDFELDISSRQIIQDLQLLSFLPEKITLQDFLKQ